MTRLELTWIGKDQRPKLEPRILLEIPEYRGPAPEKSNGATNHPPEPKSAAAHHTEGHHTEGHKAESSSTLIHGDNLLALRALEADYTGQIKCICIDPPYNTGSAFTHYDDGLEHSIWLSLMRDRLEIMRKLLSDDGSIWVFLDDNEAHYLKVMMDEIFGRGNFVCNAVWEKDKGRRNDTTISSAHDHIICFAKDFSKWKYVRNLLPRTEIQNKRYKNPDNDPNGRWLQGADGTAKSGSDAARFEITLPSGRVVTPPSGVYWRFSKATYELAVEENRVYYGQDGNRMPIIKRYLTEVQDGLVPRTVWTAEEAGTNMSAKRDHLRKLLPQITPFTTPKPEEVIHRILTIATNPGDLVLDSFAGSGTTGAVAHKMGRRWIMVEIGDHAFTHIVPRLRKVIAGEDPGGVTETTGWQGGGSFRTYRLAPTLMARDEWDNYVINPDYNPEMLAEAVCLHEGFRYAPSQTTFWEHGHATEQSFIYVTTQTLTADQLEAISAEVGPERNLLVVCSAWRAGQTPANLTLRKIPQAVLARCEWGKDDYSLNVDEYADRTDAAGAGVTSGPPAPVQQSKLF